MKDGDAADLRKLIVDLQNPQLDVRIETLEKIVEVVKELASAAVRALDHPNDGRYFMAERIPWLGTIAIPPLEELLDNPNHEVHLLAACDLLTLGSRNPQAIALLRTELASDQGDVCLSSRCLSRALAHDVAPDLLARLRKCSPDEIDRVTCLALELRELGVSIPDDLREQFTVPAAPWQVRTLFERVEPTNRG